jgi:hypothetical protein
LAGSAFHNTVTVDGRDQMDRAGRFLWLPWARGRVRGKRESPSRFFLCWEGEHDGYGRLRVPASHVRTLLRLGEEHWLVLDGLDSRKPHRYRLHWLLPDFPSVFGKEDGSLALATPEGRYRAVFGSTCGKAAISVASADENGPRGWCSHYYRDKEPALSVAVDLQDRAALFFSLFVPGDFACRLEDGALYVTTAEWRCAVGLRGDRKDRGKPNLSRAQVTGRWNDLLEMD